MGMFDLPETYEDTLRCAACGRHAHCAYVTVRMPWMRAHACQCPDCTLDSEASFELMDAGLRATYDALTLDKEDGESDIPF